MSKKMNNVKNGTGKWDFYLTDEIGDDYLHCRLMSYHLEEEGIPNALGYSGPCVKFLYEISPNTVKKRPENSLALTTGEFENYLFSKEYMCFIESCTYEVEISCRKSGEKIKMDCFTDVDEVVAAMGNEPAELELIYYSIMSVSNPMANLIYLIQLKKELAENLFTGFSGDTYLYRLEYRNWTKRLEFYIEDLDCLVPYDDGTLEDVVEGAYEWYRFGYFDFIRGISRWISFDMLEEYLGEVKISVEYLSGETQTYTITDEDEYADFLEDLCDEDAEIKLAYIEDINDKNLNDLIMNNYSEGHHIFEMVIPAENFISEFRNIPAIADNDSIVEA